ncbi:excalibur calcium-binding domain-containing protein [Ramlibacter sp. AN1133]|uniref:excalibur calcium-binding domain-containing protein n=1 Tax=Ramlibacter sp. AN1133 TaxID=3133429 RepID=UPI0030BB0799
MRFTGRLRDWNEQRGFGFIRPAEGGDDVFVHGSALPSPRPASEELLTFEVALDRQGRKKAVEVRRQLQEAAALQEDRARGSHGVVQRQFARPDRRSVSGKVPVLVTLVLLAVLGRVGYGVYGERQAARAIESSVEPENSSQPLSAQRAGTPAFTCDGRTLCSQMHSCEEATFFLRNCPGVQMDGNNDGVPCEKQWCASGGR